jgi:diadenosine tetraphosphate (Ap4A) HIT family hydrolase
MATKDFLGNTWNLGCMGCDIPGGLMKVPGGFINRTEHFVVHQDPLIPLPGFIVIGSIRHFRSIDEMKSDEYENFALLLKNTQNAIKKALKIEYLTIIQEEHSIHFHLWFFPWSEKVIKISGQPSLATVRSIMEEYKKKPVEVSEWNDLQKSINRIKALVK